MNPLVKLSSGFVIGVVLGFILISLLHIGTDIHEYHSIIKGNYDTPWYDNSWFKQPYTMFRLSGADSVKDYWTENAIGNEKWHVREIQKDGKHFWTLLERIEK